MDLGAENPSERAARIVLDTIGKGRLGSQNRPAA